MDAIGKSMTGTPAMGAPAGRTVDHAAGSVHKAIDKAADVARPVVDNLAASAHKSVDRLAGTAAQAADAFNAADWQLRDSQSRFTESCRVQVRENPIASLGIALAAGFLLSRLLSRR